ncbi:MAG: ABC transporter ATP-binding protein [Deltaproteobacteria bacterium]|nr:ABC transporter ATP-binding protein [Deltaproteobacteria bacterium]
MITDGILLQVKDLCLDLPTRQGKVRVLHNVSLSLREGETLGIVGESGCGKTMTALSIMGLQPGKITRGEIIFRGENLINVGEKRMQDIRGKEISMIFQEAMTSLDPVFTIGNQIAEVLLRHENSSKALAFERALAILRSVGIAVPDQRLREYPHQLSGGMRQRAMIAMALACKPSILIADEPTTALDVTIQSQIFDVLKQIQQNMNTSILLITHDMGTIVELTHRVIVMYAGRKVEEGMVHEVIQNPIHPYTQGLLKCVPNLQADPGLTRAELAEIPGVVPALTDRILGCPFAPRCNFSDLRCQQEMPEESLMTNTHRVFCWRVVGS